MDPRYIWAQQAPSCWGWGSQPVQYGTQMPDPNTGSQPMPYYTEFIPPATHLPPQVPQGTYYTYPPFPPVHQCQGQPPVQHNLVPQYQPLQQQPAVPPPQAVQPQPPPPEPRDQGENNFEPNDQPYHRTGRYERDDTDGRRQAFEEYRRREPRTSLPTVEIYVDGHARVNIQCTDDSSKSVSFRVSHHSMLRHASRWNNLIDFNLTVTLSVRQPAGVKAMKYLLRIVHNEPGNPSTPPVVPVTLPLNVFGYLVSLSRRLGCQDILQVWAHRWLRECEPLQIAASVRSDYPWLLYVAKELGERALYRSVARTIQFHGSIHQDGLFICSNGRKLEVLPEDEMKDSIVPVIGLMKSNRRQALQGILGAVDNFRDRLLNQRGTVCKARESLLSIEEGQRQCEGFALGLLEVRLKDGGIWPLPDPHGTRLSVEHVLGELRDVLRVRGMGWVPVEHRNCLPFDQLREEFERIMRETPVPTLE